MHASDRCAGEHWRVDKRPGVWRNWRKCGGQEADAGVGQAGVSDEQQAEVDEQGGGRGC